MGEMLQPSGTVTFLFSDIEGSTPLWDEHHDDMQIATALHDGILRRVIEDRGGYVFTTAGDEFAAAFPRVGHAVQAAVEIQAALAAARFPASTPIRVRMGLHTGEATERDGDYFGLAVIRASRLMGIAQGGQVLISGPTAEIAQSELPAGSEIKPLGEVQLKGVGRAERVNELRHPHAEREYPELSRSGRPRGRLPRITEELIGRAADVDGVVAALESSSFVTLVGLGGVGKTRLSLEVGDQLLDSYRDGCWLVELASVTSAESVDRAVAEVLGVQEVGGRALAESIVGALSGRHLLLIFDNCEHVLPAVRELIGRLRDRCDGVAILATSREALGLGGERLWPVDPLALPVAGQPSIDAPAVRLFIERWAASDPAASVDDDAAGTISEICERLDGIPLAIELAAARVRGLGLRGLAERLHGALHLLRGSHGDDRHRTLRAVVAWSFDRLEPRLQDLFCRLSVFAGGFTLESAEAVLAGDGVDEFDVADGLADLVEKSMVQVVSTSAGPRHRLLETMRQFGAERIRDEDRETVEHRFVEHMVEVAGAVDAGIYSSDPRIWFERGVAEFDNFREACRLGVARGWHDETATILISLGEFGIARIVGEVFVLMAELAAQLHAGHPQELKLMAADAFNAHTRGETALAQQYLARFEALDSTDLGRLDAKSLTGFASAHWILGNTSRAIELEQTAIAKHEADGDLHQAARVLSTLSMAQDAIDRSAARKSAERVIQLGESLDSPMVVCHGLLALAGVLAHSDYASARETAARLVDTARNAGALWSEATATRLEGHAASRAGDLHAASRTLADALDLNGVGDFGELLWYTVLNVLEHLVRAELFEDAAVTLGAFSSAPGASRDELVTRATRRLDADLRAALTDNVYGDRYQHGTELATGELLIYLDGTLRSHASQP